MVFDPADDTFGPFELRLGHAQARFEGQAPAEYLAR